MRNAIALALGCVAMAQALVGDWTSYTPLFGIRAFAEAKGFLFAGTGGGIRKLNPATRAETVYRNREGLRDVGINAMVASPQGDVFATSELGYLYRYDWAADAWEILDAGYKGAGWRMNKRALAYRSGYLVLGSVKGLSFFNVKRKVAEANVTKLGSVSGVSVNSLLFVGDTLFAGTSQGIFKGVIHLDRLLTDPQINIFNPAIWTNVVKGGLYFDPFLPVRDSTDSASSFADPDTGLHLPDSAAPERAHGLLYYGAKGIASDYEGALLDDPPSRVSRFRSTLVVDGKEYPNPYAMEVLGKAAGKLYIGSVQDMFEIRPGDTLRYSLLYNPATLPYRPINVVRADRDGVFGLANPVIYELKGHLWDSAAAFVGLDDPQEWQRRGLHAFDLYGPGRYVAGLWGSGVHAILGAESIAFDASNSCIETATATNPNFPAMYAMTPYRNRGYFFTTLLEAGKYGLSYLDLVGRKMICLKPDDNRGQQGRSLQVVGDTMLVVVTERGLEAYRIRDEGGPLSIDPGNMLPFLPQASEPALAGSADAYGNFWVTTEGASMLYVPGLATRPDSARAYHSLEGFTGVACKNLERDPQGHLWTGCTEGGVFEVIPGKDTTLHTFRKYGLNDGLISETIFNLSVNPDNGDVWVATEKGIARYESPSRPARTNLSEVKAYPNPFLPKHHAVVFDNLAAGSEVEVLTQGGEVVFRRSLSKGGAGDQIQWDGKNPAGRRVTEGVYFYVVKSPKETKHGKLIVAR